MATSISVRNDIIRACIPPVLVVLLVWLSSFLPLIGPYLLWHFRFKIQFASYPQFHIWSGVSVELPIWTWLPIFAVPWAVGKIVRRRRVRPSARRPEPERVTIGGVEWEVSRDFFDACREVEDPAFGALSISGPFCTECGASLHESRYGLGDEYKTIPFRCQVCGIQHGVEPGVSIADAKSQVYRALQGQVRAGKFPLPPPRQ
jgi:hypothetical protein